MPPDTNYFTRRHRLLTDQVFMQVSLKFPRQETNQFFAVLRQRVNQYFQEKNISKNGNTHMVVKTIAMLSIYFVPYALILTGWLPGWAMLLLAMVMGVGMSGIGFSVMHDSNHGSYSKNSIVNRILGHTMELLGGSSFTWKMQHNLLHHTYTNVYELDEDIDDKPILRLSPYGKWKKIHRYQHWYAFLLYSLATLGWVTDKDFVQLIRYNRQGLTEKSGHRPGIEWARLIAGKLVYFGYTLVIPFMVLDAPWWGILLGFVLMHMVSGVLITTVFQLAHVVEGPSHHEPEPSGVMENTWAIHQLLTTANFARKNRLITWFVGGLNFQVEHHLFPHICHVHYKHLSEIVRKTAKEFNLPYHDHPTFWKAVASHVRTLKLFGHQPALAK